MQSQTLISLPRAAVGEAVGQIVVSGDGIWDLGGDRHFGVVLVEPLIALL